MHVGTACRALVASALRFIYIDDVLEPWEVSQRVQPLAIVAFVAGL